MPNKIHQTAIVSDGCSSSTDTDIGARILVRCAIDTLNYIFSGKKIQLQNLEKQIEKMILDSLIEVVDVIVHVDPCEEPLCGRGFQDQCQDRGEDNKGASNTWRVEKVVMKRVDSAK